MHDSYAATSHHDTVTRIYAEEIIQAFREQMQEAERLAGELQDLLMQYETMVEREGSTDQVETLVRWAECYSAGLSAAGKISRDGQAWLCAFSQKLGSDPRKGEKKSETIEKTWHDYFSVGHIASIQSKHVASMARQNGKAPRFSEFGHDLFPIRRSRV